MFLRFILYMTAVLCLAQALIAMEESKDFEFFYYNHGDMSKLKVKFFNPFESQDLRSSMFDVLHQRIEREAYRTLGPEDAERAKLTSLALKVLHEDFRILRDAEACGKKSMIALIYDNTYKEAEKRDFVGFVMLHHNLLIPNKDEYTVVIENAAFSTSYPGTIYMRTIEEIQDFLAELYRVETFEKREQA